MKMDYLIVNGAPTLDTLLDIEKEGYKVLHIDSASNYIAAALESDVIIFYAKTIRKKGDVLNG